MARVFQRTVNGQKVWCLDYNDHQGRRRREITNALTKSEAQAFLGKKLNAIERGELGFVTAKKVHFKDFIPVYTRIKRDSDRLRSMRRVELSLSHLERFFGNSLLHAITPRDVEAYRLDRKKRGVQDATVNREVAQLKNLLNVARREGALSGPNPLAGLKMMKEGRREYPPITELHVKKLLELADPRLQPILQVAVSTALRKTNILSLRWVHINWERNEIYIPRTKRGGDHVVPLSPATREILLCLKGEDPASEYVFFHERSKAKRRLMDVKSWWNETKALLKKTTPAGEYRQYFERLRFHDLRHYAASRMYQRTKNIRIVAQVLDHASSATTERYLHNPSEDVVNAVHQMDEVIGNGAQLAHGQVVEQVKH